MIIAIFRFQEQLNINVGESSTNGKTALDWLKTNPKLTQAEKEYASHCLQIYDTQGYRKWVIDSYFTEDKSCLIKEAILLSALCADKDSLS